MPILRENALFMDFSNTITTVQSEDDAIRRYIKFVREKKGIKDERMYENFRELRLKKLVEREKDFRTFVEINKEVMSELYSISDTYEEEYYQFHEKFLRTREDFIPFIKLVRNRVKVVMITDADNIYTERTLRALGIKKYFDYIVTAEEVRAPKPYPPIFERGLKLADNPRRTAHVGDSERRDISGAKAMGLISILMDDDTKPTTADATVHNFDDLMKLLTKMKFL